MKKTILLFSSNREVEQRTKICMSRARQAGALLWEQRGTSDVSVARNIALTGACALLRERKHDTVLMVDDDMVWAPQDAQSLVTASRRGTAVSAIYSSYTAQSETVSIAAQYIPKEREMPKRRGSWVTGLGLIAIPAELLLELERSSEKFQLGENNFVQFTKSELKYGRWWSEDYYLCERLGGVHLSDVRAGHIKRVPIWPTDELVAKLFEQAAEH